MLMDCQHICRRRQKNLIKSFPLAQPTERMVVALILVSLLKHMLQGWPVPEVSTSLLLLFIGSFCVSPNKHRAGASMILPFEVAMQII